MSHPINAEYPKQPQVTELPVKRWTQDYKQFLESMTVRGREEKDDDDGDDGFLTLSTERTPPHAS